VHRFLLANGGPLKDVRQQYLQDLRERWMFYSDPIERHQKARMFSGRLVELQVAVWLESQDWTISSLEALREGPDIEAYVNDDRTTAFEVKFIGTEDDDFNQIVKSLAKNRAVGKSASLYDPVDYLLFRCYEAAKQLEKYSCDRIAIIIIDESVWSARFALQVKKNWIDWAHPTFFLVHDFEEFLKSQPYYPKVINELQPVLARLNAIWILTRSAHYQYRCEFTHDLSE